MTCCQRSGWNIVIQVKNNYLWALLTMCTARGILQAAGATRQEWLTRLSTWLELDFGSAVNVLAAAQLCVSRLVGGYQMKSGVGTCWAKDDPTAAGRRMGCLVQSVPHACYINAVGRHRRPSVVEWWRVSCIHANLSARYLCHWTFCNGAHAQARVTCTALWPRHDSLPLGFGTKALIDLFH